MAASVAAATVTTGITLYQDYTSDAQPLPEAVMPVMAQGSLVVDQNQSRAVAVRQSLPPRQFVYGACRIGGPVFFQDNDNPYLFIGTCLSDGPIEAITGVFFGNQEITLAAESPAGVAEAAAGSVYAGALTISYRLGTATQTADTVLDDFASFALPSDFWQRGVATGVCKLHWGQDSATHQILWGQSLNPSFSGQFRLVYDPRDSGQTLGDRTTYEYSDNPALCVADALTSAWGVALPTSAIDWQSVADAANVCDQTLTYDGDTVKLFTLAGVFRSESDLAGQIAQMLGTFRGVITFADGKYKIKADAPRSAVLVATDDDILEILDHVHGASRSDAYNTIKATYFDNADADRESVTEPYEDAAAVAAEGTRETAISLPFCPAVHSAQILAYRRLKELRNGRRLNIRLSDAAMSLEAFELIEIASSSVTFINGVWQIDQIDMDETGFTLALREYVPAMYDLPSTYLV